MERIVAAAALAVLAYVTDIFIRPIASTTAATVIFFIPSSREMRPSGGVTAWINDE